MCLLIPSSIVVFAIKDYFCIRGDHNRQTHVCTPAEASLIGKVEVSQLVLTALVGVTFQV